MVMKIYIIGYKCIALVLQGYSIIFSSDKIRLHEVLPHERVFHLGKINVSQLAF